MPDFIAALLATATFCLALLALNALTRLALHWHVVPGDFAEGSLLQYGGAAVLARSAYRRTLQTGVGPD